MSHLGTCSSSPSFSGGHQRAGGIVARVHLLKDTGSGACQHPLRTYTGTSSTAEGYATEQALTLLVVHPLNISFIDGRAVQHWVRHHQLTLFLQEQGVQLSSVTADGDTEIASIVAVVCPKGDVIINHDPNHYAKGLSKHVTNLCSAHPALKVIVASLKAHFLIGSFPTCSPLNFLSFSLILLWL